MRAERWERFAELLDAALELGREQRARWLAGLAGADAELRDELAEWLAQDDASRGFLETPLAPGASWEREPWLPHAPGATVGRYRVQRVIGLGGTSVVYEAEQDEPRRAVALKVFQTGLAGSRGRERFEEEARILASLRHPAIAQVFEAGTEGAGDARRPWIAMELVRGARPLTRYAREERLELRARLALFARVCDAVAHGHQRGVIHRDLKPANLLVDAAGEPKVIDFGVAKVLEHGASVAAAMTGGPLGTLAWMSPEQLGGSPGPVDTRVDVYALGVVLYELACGAPPHALDGLPLEEAVRVARNDAPPRPSSVAPEVDRDLDAVVLTALAKDPDARYRTAGELAADLRRHLAREPVVARPPSVLHHLRLSLARHRRAALATGTGLTLIVAALAFGLLRAQRVEARERAKAEEVTDFLMSVLSLASPSEGRRADLTMREVLEEAGGRIDAELADAPDARAQVHAVVGSAWRELGRYERSEEHLRAAAEVYRATRPGSEERANALSILSEVLLAAGRGAEAEEVLREARALHARLPEQPEFFLGIVTRKLAEARRLQGDLEGAEELAREALAIYRRAFGPRHVAVAAALRELSAIQAARGEVQEAESSLREALAIQREVSGDDGLAVAQLRLLLSELLAGLERPDEAAAELTAAEPRFAALLPAGHPDRERAEALRRALAGGE